MGDLAFLSGRTAEAKLNFEVVRDESEAMLEADRGAAQELRKQLALALDKLGDLARFAAAALAVERVRQSLRRMAERPGMTSSLAAAIESACAERLAVYRAAERAIQDEASIDGHPPEIALSLKRLRALQLARSGRRDGAARVAQELERGHPGDVETLLAVARVYAICAGSTTSKTAAPAAAQVRDYGDRAVDALAKAIKIEKGSIIGSSFQPDFESIAHHPRLAPILQIEP